MSYVPIKVDFIESNSLTGWTLHKAIDTSIEGFEWKIFQSDSIKFYQNMVSVIRPDTPKMLTLDQSKNLLVLYSVPPK